MSTTPPQSAAQPIPAASHHHHGRARSASVYSISSLPGLSNSPSVSPNSPTLPQLSPSLTGKSLSAIFSGPQSPLKSNSFFSSGGGLGGGGGPGIVMEDDDHDHDDFHGELPASPPRSHTRHSSISWGSAPRVAASEMDNRIDRGNGLLRRLSLGSAFGNRPNPAMFAGSSPPQTVAAPTPRMAAAPAVRHEAPVARKPSPLRGNSLGLGGLAPAQDPIKHRGVSPMGERMLKGHFDGFN